MAIIGEIRSVAFDSDSGFLNALKKNGWMVCDGRKLLVSEYEQLHKRIGDGWGSPKPGTNFCIPDLRGSFLRGATLSATKTLDKDLSTRQPPRPEFSGSGGTTGGGGIHVGSFQESDFQSHSHPFSGKKAGGGTPHFAHFAVGTGPSDVTQNTTVSGGRETRPVNHSVLFIIFAGKKNVYVDENFS